MLITTIKDKKDVLGKIAKGMIKVKGREEAKREAANDGGGT